jgi:Endosomal/lysosomal potassium channel TMEM175
LLDDRLKESAMATREVKPDRLSALSDGVFAVIIGIPVLELKPPQSPSLKALFSLCPTAVSYAVSYLFITIVRVNHHHLLRYADRVTPRLIWENFSHLLTAWIANTELAAIPVMVHAGVFVLVNATYIVPSCARMMLRTRSLVTLGIFSTAAIVALKHPAGGMALICPCLIVYLPPDAPGVKMCGSEIRRCGRER